MIAVTADHLDDVEAEQQRQAIENVLAEMRSGGNSGPIGIGLRPTSVAAPQPKPLPEAMKRLSVT